MSFSAFGMEKDEKGIFLDQIVSQYKNPIRVSLMHLENNGYGTELTRKGVKVHLAIVTAAGPQFFNRTIKTADLMKRSKSSLRLKKVAEVACLRIEDLAGSQGLLTSTETYVWLRKEWKGESFAEDTVQLYASDKLIEEFTGEDRDNTGTRITLNIPANYLGSGLITVTSKTTSIRE